ncbi:MAG: xanthine dehydrogenase family protein molybdopterin-binding subunit [Pigmentiphaga sp.]
MTTSTTQRPPFRSIGHGMQRLEVIEKVTGRAHYTHHVKLPGMLHAKIVRSHVAHGRLNAIHVDEAKAIGGVVAVVTGQDIQQVIPNPYFGPAFHDQPILALDKVRYVGEPIAVVLAESASIAEEAAGYVYAEIDELPAVFNEVEAMTSSTYVHESLRPAGTFADLKHLNGIKNTNVALAFQLKKGDTDQAFASAAHVFDDTFTSQQVMHAPLEPMISLADVGPREVSIWTASQSPSFVRMEIARLLGWRENQVKVLTGYLGGGFGAKLYIKLEALAVALSLVAGRPVRVALTMAEQFYTITRHATTFRIQTAVDASGKITGRRCDVVWNGGAYADIGPRVTQKSGFTAPGPYSIENVDITSTAVYTNLPPAGAFRGFGIPQLVWAYESQADIIARKLGMDPIAFRLQNALSDGKEHATGTMMKDAAIPLVLNRLSEKFDWPQTQSSQEGRYRRGKGMGVGIKACVAPTTSVAIVTIAADGSCSVQTNTVDMGQGSDTVMAMIVAEVLGVSAAEVNVMPPNTEATPYDMATLGSRSTFHMGHAVRLAAEDALKKLKAMAAEVGVEPVEPGHFREVFLKRYGMQAGTIIGSGTYMPTYQSPDKGTGQSADITPNWMIGGCAMEVEVDTWTGMYTILRMENVVDCGTPMNPKVVDTQISGAAIMQLGTVTLEQMEFDEQGQLRNAGLSEYKIPGIQDIPQHLGREAVDAYQENGPFGAKGLGESAAFGVASALAAAIEDAVGVRIKDLPIRPQKIWEALQTMNERKG